VDEVKKFHDKHDLGFTLLADSDHAVCEAYGVWREKQMYGNKYMGVVRSSFLIGPDGVVERVLENVKAAQHDDIVLGALAG
jgi:peroxiredoxin Q/BCP